MANEKSNAEVEEMLGYLTLPDGKGYSVTVTTAENLDPEPLGLVYKGPAGWFYGGSDRVYPTRREAALELARAIRPALWGSP